MIAISANSRTTRGIDAGNQCFLQVPPSTDRATPSNFSTIALPHVWSRLLALPECKMTYVGCCVRGQSFGLIVFYPIHRYACANKTPFTELLNSVLIASVNSVEQEDIAGRHRLIGSFHFQRDAGGGWGA